MLTTSAALSTAHVLQCAIISVAKKAETASELVQQWKDEGVYPFSGDAGDELEQARREVFDISTCALL